MAKCVITVDGALDQCRLIQDTPPFSAEVMRVLAGWRMTPVTFAGRRVPVDFTFPFTFKCSPTSP